MSLAGYMSPGGREALLPVIQSRLHDSVIEEFDYLQPLISGSFRRFQSSAARCSADV